jgi:hypothetical protein
MQMAVAPAPSRLIRGRAVLGGAVALTVALWASAFVAIRYADRSLSPGALALGRLVVGSLALGLLVLIRRERLPGRRAWPGILVCGPVVRALQRLAERGRDPDRRRHGRHAGQCRADPDRDLCRRHPA